MDRDQFDAFEPRFENRADAGRKIADALARDRCDANSVVIGLPRGGVVTAAAAAGALDLALDIVVVRKLGCPGREELAMGAIGPEDVRVLNWDVIAAYRITPEAIEEETRRQKLELERREQVFRGHQRMGSLRSKNAILVDDGLATGATMEAAIAAVRRRDARRVIVAVPVSPIETLRRLNGEVDELFCLETPDPFLAVGYWYADFDHVGDDDVRRILDASRPRIAAA